MSKVNSLFRPNQIALKDYFQLILFTSFHKLKTQFNFTCINKFQICFHPHTSSSPSSQQSWMLLVPKTWENVNLSQSMEAASKNLNIYRISYSSNILGGSKLFLILWYYQSGFQRRVDNRCHRQCWHVSRNISQW
jgi:triacylglycerol esterase/lipase EstA (alpha/beta hydrolase family)